MKQVRLQISFHVVMLMMTMMMMMRHVITTVMLISNKSYKYHQLVI